MNKEPIYIIDDVHGCYKTLLVLIDFLSIKNNLILPKNITQRGCFTIVETVDYFTYNKCIKLQILDKMTKDNFRLDGIDRLSSNDQYTIHTYITQDFMKILNDIE